MIFYFLGLDPAGPLIFKNMRISRRSGKMVETVHTCNVYGNNRPDGHINFYFNHAVWQPGCVTPFKRILGCSHKRAPAYWIEALSHPKSFIAMLCHNYFFFICKKRLCSPVRDFVGRSGFNNYSRVSGDYYLHTNNKPPYGKGEGGLAYTATPLFCSILEKQLNNTENCKKPRIH